MLKKLLISLGVVSLISVASYAKVTQAQCEEKGEEYLFAGDECMQLSTFEGDDNEHIVVLIHGSWKPGTNILGRYGPFAESLNMNTDKTIVAVALPWYSGSSKNNMPPLEHDAKVSPSATPEYVKFLGEVIQGVKDKYEASEITYVGHSAGARMGATLSAMKPGLIQNAVLVGGGFATKTENKKLGAVSFYDVMDKADKSTKYVLVYGTADKISPPKRTIDAFEKMKKAGFDATLVKAEGKAHLDLEMTDASMDAISALFE
jgi:pimeloyl-ACP methyl ester carboxylesterase